MIQGRKASKGRVVDVSFTGLFFTTINAPPLRDLVKIDLDLPGGGKTRILGMAVHVVRPSLTSKRRPGVGVQLFGIGPDVRAEWDRFVAGVRKAYQKAHETGTAPDPAQTGDLSVAPTGAVIVPETAGPEVEAPTTVRVEPKRPERTAPTDSPKPFPTPVPKTSPVPVSAVPTTSPVRGASPVPTTSPPQVLVLGPPPEAAESESAIPSAVADTGLDEPLDLDGPTDTFATTQDVDNAFEFLQSPGGEDAPAPADPRPTYEEGPGDVAPGDGPEPDLDELFEVAKPELRVHVTKPEEIEPLRERQARGEQLFFRTEVHMAAGTELQVRVLLPSGETAFIAEGRVMEAVTDGAAPGLRILLSQDDVSSSEDIYITIDLDNDWLQSTT